MFGLGEALHLPPPPLLPPHPRVSPSHTSESCSAPTCHTRLEPLEQLKPCWCDTQIYIDQLVVLQQVTQNANANARIFRSFLFSMMCCQILQR